MGATLEKGKKTKTKTLIYVREQNTQIEKWNANHAKNRQQTLMKTDLFLRLRPAMGLVVLPRKTFFIYI